MARRSLIVSMHRGGREVAVRQLADEAGLVDADERRVHAALGAVGIGEIALLHREHDADRPATWRPLRSAAHQEIGERRLGLSLGLRLLRLRCDGLMLRLRSLHVRLGLLVYGQRLLWGG